MWCGTGHLHRDCPEKTNENSTPRCCNCVLAEGRNRTLRITMAEATRKRKPPLEELNEPLRRRLQLGESFPSGTRPWHFPSQQHCAEMPIWGQLGDGSHSLSSPIWEQRKESASRRQCVQNLRSSTLRPPVLPVRP